MRKHILSVIKAHAADEYPKECCGLLLAVGHKQQYFPCRNIAREPNEEFRLDPEDYAAAEDLGEVIGIVHSHPDATSRPSPHDLAMCEATALPWHILSWPEGDLRAITPTDYTPLLKRPFVHCAWDCWQVCADWYKREWGLEFKPSSGRAIGGRVLATPVCTKSMTRWQVLCRSTSHGVVT